MPDQHAQDVDNTRSTRSAATTARPRRLPLLALHSLGDYPLRTSALLAVAGVLAAQVMAMREIRLSRAPDGARLGPLFNP